MSTTLNRNRPYGEIWGGNVPARFEQEGKFFDHEGKQVDLRPEHYDGVDSAPRAEAPKLVSAAPTQEGGDGRIDVTAALAERRNTLLLQAIPLLEKGQADVIPDLPDHDIDLLGVMLEIEGVAKKRKAVLEALSAEIAAKQEQARRDEQANGLDADQLGQQLGA